MFCNFRFVLYIFNRRKMLSFHRCLQFWKEKKVSGSQIQWIQRLRHDYGLIFGQKLTLKHRYMSWCLIIHDWFFRNSMYFWRIILRNRSKVSNFGIIFAATRFMPKIFVKIAWHLLAERNANIISNFDDYPESFSFLLQCWRARTISKSIVIEIFSVFLIISQLIFSSTHSSQRPNETVNISNVLAHSISYFTQTLLQLLRSNFSNRKNRRITKENA